LEDLIINLKAIKQHIKMERTVRVIVIDSVDFMSKSFKKEPRGSNK
jgi:hypothetical protein